MNATTLFFLCVIVLEVGVTQCTGQIKGTERCICTKDPIKQVRINRVKTIERFPPSTFCPKIEMLVTLMTGKKLCLDPHGIQGRMFLKNKRTRPQKKNPKRKQGKKKQRN